MSTTEEEMQDTEGRESGLLRRTFTAELTAGDGRTIDARIVPYGETATVNDGGGVFTEEFERGAFDAQLGVAHRVYLNFEHQHGLQGIVGRGLTLRSDHDALYGSFRAFENADGDKALTLVKEGVLGGLSIEFVPKRSVRTAAGVVRRVKAHIDAVALCRTPAYASAAVLAVREAPIMDEELLPTDIDPELVARCRRLGIALPQRYQAHPEDETDTPSGEGTSEVGTRQTHNTSTSED